MLELEGQIKMEYMCLSLAVSWRWLRIELGRSFHQEGTFNEKLCESDFVPLWDGTIKRYLTPRGHIQVHLNKLE